MTAEQFIEAKNWGKFQHYKDGRNVIWIKVYIELINRRCKEYNRLADLSKLLLLHLWLLAGDENNRIEFDAEWLQERLNLKEPIDLAPLFDAGFIRLIDEDGGEVEQEATPEQPTEEKPKREKKPKADPLASHPVLAARFDEVAAAIVSRHPEATLPKDQEKLRAIREDFDRLVRIDKLSQSDIVDSLVWLFTIYQRTDKFDLSNQFRRLSALRPAKKWNSGETKMEFLIKEWNERPTKKREERQVEAITFERGEVTLQNELELGLAMSALDEHKREEIIFEAERKAPLIRGAHFLRLDSNGPVFSFPNEQSEIDDWLASDESAIETISLALIDATTKRDERTTDK